jgi:hypothetical protein
MEIDQEDLIMIEEEGLEMTEEVDKEGIMIDKMVIISQMTEEVVIIEAEEEVDLEVEEEVDSTIIEIILIITITPVKVKIFHTEVLINLKFKLN